MTETSEALFVRKGEMARLLSVSVRTLDSWVNTRRVSVIRIGGVVLFDPAKVRKEVEQFEVNAITAIDS